MPAPIAPATRRLLALLLALAPLSAPVFAVERGGTASPIASQSGLVLASVYSEELDTYLPAIWDSRLGGYVDTLENAEALEPLALPSGSVTEVYTTVINSSGSFIGGMVRVDGVRRAFVWENRIPTDVTPELGAAYTLRHAEISGVNPAGTHAFGFVNSSTVSGDSTNYFTQAFRWSGTGGSTLLPSLENSNNAFGNAISSDGSILVGQATLGTSGYHAVFWSADNAIHDIHPAGVGTAGYSYAADVNAAGDVIAINTYDDDVGSRVYRWTPADDSVVLAALPDSPERYDTIYRGMSTDGDVFAGIQVASVDELYQSRAFRWTSEGGMVDITPVGASVAQVDALSSDGNVVAGQYRKTDQYYSVYRWTSATGAQDILASATLAEGATTGLNYDLGAMTPDGSVIVGGFYRNDELTSDISDYVTEQGGFVWSVTEGYATVQDWLAASGVTVPEAMDLGPVSAVSDDGQVIVGQIGGSDLDRKIASGTYLARAGVGLIDVAEATRSVSATSRAIGSVRANTHIVLNGAHGHPLARRAAKDKWITWGAGDLGRDDHAARDGSLSVAEIGLGRNLGRAQLNFALGRTDGHQRTELNGGTRHDGRFLIADLIVPVPNSPFLVTLTGIRHDSDLKTSRGYLNAGSPALSEGATESTGYGAAVRLDWENATTLGGVRLTPFSKLALSRTKIDGFNESTGPFPAAYGELADTLTDAHLGVDLSYALTKNARLIGTLEGIHRFQDESAATTYSIPGVAGGGVAPGDDYKQSWLSGGLGGELDVGPGTFSLSLNATTEGPAANVWVASSYRYQF